MNKANKNTILALLLTCSLSPFASMAETVVVFGATGSVGSSIVEEALSRNHAVIGVSRSPEKFSYSEANFKGVAGDPTDLESVAELAAMADAIIVSVGSGQETDPAKTPMARTATALTVALKEQGKEQPHLVVIGGGTTMMTLEELSDFMPESGIEGTPAFGLFMGHREALQIYRDSSINWTFVAPPMRINGYQRINGGESSEDIKTGNYRTSTEDFVKDAGGENAISMSDLAVAVIDFAEKGLFNKQKVAVGY